MSKGVNQGDRVLIFFDGYCHLCDGMVRFLVDRDDAEVFVFSSLSSDFAHQFFESRRFELKSLDSIIVYKEAVFYVKSDAIVAIAQSMTGIWRVFSGLRFLPKGVRDWLYGLVARNRYRLMGRRSACRIPTPEEAKRFLS